MSDNAVEGGKEVRRGFRRCTDTAGCPGSSHSATLRTDGEGSPSRSRSPKTEEFDSGSSSGCLPRQPEPSSEENCETTTLDALPEHEWSGIRRVRISDCEHGHHTVMKKVWGGKNCGRCFIGCPLENEAEHCGKMIWMDEPWPETVQETLKKLWKELKTTKCREEAANQAQQDSLNTGDASTLARAALTVELGHTKRCAQRVVGLYEKKQAVVMVHRSRLMYLNFVLLGLIFFLVAALVGALVFK